MPTRPPLAVIRGVTEWWKTLADQLTLLVVEILYLNLEVLLAGNLAIAVVKAGGSGYAYYRVSNHSTPFWFS